MYKVLLVEDEVMLRKGVMFMVDFTACGCVVIAEAENGQEGVHKIKSLHPDIVISDVRMPLMDGIEMLKATRDEEYSAIILSGYDDFSYAKQAMKYGACEYLLKPVNQEEMEEALHTACQQQNMRHIYSKAMKQKESMKDIHILEVQVEDVADHIAQSMLQFIEQNYSKKILMMDLCVAMHYSETLLHRKFKESFHCTFNDYLNRYRIQKAVEAIQISNASLEDIAIQCGFTNYKYFSTVFRKYTSYTPSSFQKHLKER